MNDKQKGMDEVVEALMARLLNMGDATERLLARYESYLIARTIEAFANAAASAQQVDDGWTALAALKGARQYLNDLGLDPTADDRPDLGPRGVFDSESGKYRTANGTEWDFAGTREAIGTVFGAEPTPEKPA